MIPEALPVAFPPVKLTLNVEPGVIDSVHRNEKRPNPRDVNVRPEMEEEKSEGLPP
jgi:hypothetical protein